MVDDRIRNPANTDVLQIYWIEARNFVVFIYSMKKQD